MEEKLSEKKEKESATITVHDEKTYTVSPEIRNDLKESIVHLFRSDREFVKEIFCEAFEMKNESLVIKQMDELVLKQIDKGEAEKQIQEFIETNPGCKTSDLIMNLELDPPFVIEILKELKKENIVQTEDV